MSKQIQWYKSCNNEACDVLTYKCELSDNSKCPACGAQGK